MIIVKLNQPGFEYDIHSLVKSFYPAEDVYVSVQEKQTDEPVLFYMECQYATDEIRLSVWKEKEKREDKPLNEQYKVLAGRMPSALYNAFRTHGDYTSVGNIKRDTPGQDPDAAFGRGKEQG